MGLSLWRAQHRARISNGEEEQTPSHVPSSSFCQSPPAAGMKNRSCSETGSVRSCCNSGCLNKIKKG
ncbi:hypothetical protein Chor_013010 [Crotalus horridus]